MRKKRERWVSRTRMGDERACEDRNEIARETNELRDIILLSRMHRGNRFLDRSDRSLSLFLSFSLQSGNLKASSKTEHAESLDALEKNRANVVDTKITRHSAAPPFPPFRLPPRPQFAVRNAIQRSRLHHPLSGTVFYNAGI